MTRRHPRSRLLFPFLLLLWGCGDSGGGGGGQAALLAAIGGPSAEADGSFAYDVTIAFTNDIHDQIDPLPVGDRGGMARQVSVLGLMRQQAASRGKRMLAINAGDNFEGSLFYENDGGALLFELLELAGYDVVQVGNHDHQFGVQALYDVLEAAFPGFQQRLRVLWGNVNPSHLSAIGTDPALAGAFFLPAQVTPEAIAAFENAFSDFDTGAVDPTLMDAPLANSKVFNQTLFYDLDGLRIGLFGLDTDEALYASVPGEADLFLDPDGRANNLRFYPPATHSFASAMIDYLSDPDSDPMTDDGADLIIAVTHLGFDLDQQLAMNAVGQNGRRIDVIVGGHSHDRINTNVVVDHPGGARTQIVQAGAHGEFVGRIDLAIDAQAGGFSVKNCELVQVDDRFPEDAAAQELIAAARSGPNGVDLNFASPFTTIVAQSQTELPGGVAAISALGNLAADATRSIGNAPPFSLGLDCVVVGNFVFRGDLPAGSISVADVHQTLPLHQLTLTGRDADVLDFIDLPGGLREAADPSGFPVPNPNIVGITSTEYFLEIIYGISDLLAQLGSVLGFDIGSIDSFIQGLQWSGIEFVVDPSAPIFQRIDPASIVIDGVPLVGNEGSPHRLGLNSIVARVALPFIQLFAAIEDAPGSGSLMPFPTYDPGLNGTDLVIWEALRDHLQSTGLVDGGLVRVDGQRPRTLEPDLTFNPIDVTVPAVVSAGQPFAIEVPVLNLGQTAVTGFQLTVSYDPTPETVADDPDGFTDARTGAAFPVLATTAGGAVAGYSSVTGTVPAPVSVSITLPPGTAPGIYPLFIRIDGLQSTSAESVIANNGGPRYAVRVVVGG